MFENYRELSVEEQKQIRDVHARMRARWNGGREWNLAWGFVRGFPYRRIERKTRTQTLSDGSVVIHNRPDPRFITLILAHAIPGFVASFDPKKSFCPAHPDVVAWLLKEEGAIPEPVREKRASIGHEEVLEKSA